MNLCKHKIFGEELTFGEMEEGRLSFFTSCAKNKRKKNVLE